MLFYIEYYAILWTSVVQFERIIYSQQIMKEEIFENQKRKQKHKRPPMRTQEKIYFGISGHNKQTRPNSAGFCCGSLLLLVLAVRIYTLVQLLC